MSNRFGRIAVLRAKARKKRQYDCNSCALPALGPEAWRDMPPAQRVRGGYSTACEFGSLLAALHTVEYRAAARTRCRPASGSLHRAPAALGATRRLWRYPPGELPASLSE